MENDFKYLGKEAREATKELDTFEAPPLMLVSFETDELTSHCPVTGQPDFYHATIEYRPNNLCLESKSMKLYLMSFRDTAQFAEHLADEIAQTIKKTINPKWVRVNLKQQVRGGLQLTAEAYYEQ